MKIAIQGEPGSFHFLAARHYYGAQGELVCCPSFASVFKALEEGQADRAIVAIENSLYGSIVEVYDLLQAHHYPIVGEVIEHITQNLITLPGASLESITHVYSHPVALAQCATFLDEKLPHATRVGSEDTAGSVEIIKELGNPAFAAIAGTVAAEMHDLPILTAGIQDQKQNFTRFLAIEPTGKKSEDTNKTSLIITTSHEPGALYKALGIFAAASINVTKLQSRPIPDKPWNYEFYIDIETAGVALQQCIEQLHDQGCQVDVLGEYKAAALTFED